MGRMRAFQTGKANFQTTLAESVECSGVGLHGGRKVTLGLKPAPADTGIVFDVHTQDGVKRIKPSARAVIATGFATTLGADGASVATVEHLLGALSGLSIDNVIVDVTGGEVPILDGSAALFARIIQTAGVRRLNCARRVMRITRPVIVEQDGKFISAEPHDGFFVDCAIEFPHPLIKKQRRRLEVTPASFVRTVASARTFGFLREIEYLYQNGLALGGSLENAIVLDETGVVNPEGLRFKDEFVRHKILDFIGDMAMFGQPLQGKFTLHCSGHGLNNAFLRHLEENRSQYLEEVRLPVPARTPAFGCERAGLSSALSLA